MIDFDLRVIIPSIICAVIFGAGFGFFYCIITLVKTTLERIPKVGRDIMIFDKIFPLPPFEYLSEGQNAGRFITGVSIILFGVGFSILSYVALDGQIRIYMLLFSSASFFLSKFLFSEICVKLFLLVLKQIIRAFALALRIIILPFKLLKRKIAGRNITMCNKYKYFT